MPLTKITASNINSTGVTAGSYTNANITVNEAGQITSASNGVAGSGGSGGGTGLQHTTYTYTANGSTTTFAATSGITVHTVLAVIDGVTQTPTADYTVSGSNVIFTSAPPASSQIQLRILGDVASSGSGGPKISAITITDNSYVAVDDTAVDTSGGYIKLTGTGFVSGCLVYFNQTPAASVGFVSSTELQVGTGALAAGTYVVYVINSDGGVAISVPGVTFSSLPSWQTASGLADQYDATLISLQLLATAATSYTLISGSLPPGLSLSSSGLITGTVTGVTVDTTYTFTVRATDSELQDSPRTFTVTITVSDPYFKLTTLLLGGEQGNTVVKDSSVNNFNLTVFGDSRATNFTPYGTGWSNYFDGTGDYLSIPSNAAFAFGTGDFTIEFWFYPTTGVARNITFPTSGAPIFYMNGSRQLQFEVYGTTPSVITTNILNLNAWNHCAVSRASGTVKVFVNGVTGVTSTAFSATNFVQSSVNIGTDAGTNFATGFMSYVRITKGGALYTADFTPSTTPLTTTVSAGTVSLLTCNANRFLDSSTNNFTVTRNGDVAVRSFNPFNITNTGDSGSMYFDGTGDYLQSNITTLSGEFTVEFWFYRLSSGNNVMFTIGDSFTDTGAEVYIGSSGTLLQYYSNNLTRISSTAPNIGSWSYIAVTRDASNVVRLYVNGVQVGSNYTHAATLGTVLRIGAEYYNGSIGGTVANGYISDFRISNTARTISVPTQQLTAIANTQLLTLQYRQPHNNHGFQDSSSNQFLITRNGNASQGTFSPFSQSGWSVLFTRSNNTDRVLVSSNAGLGLQSNNFTVELWAYFNSAYTGDGPFCVNIPSGGFTANTWWFGPHSVNSGRVTVYIYNFSSSGPFIAEATSPPVNQWVHYALVRSSNTFTIYRNGVPTATGTFSGAVSSSTSLLYIGRAGDAGATASGFDGYISNLRIVNGVAVYTGTFTPPTVQLTITQSTGANIAAITGTQTGLLCLQSNRLLDNSTFAASLSMDAGSPKIQAFSPFAPTAVYNPATHSGSMYLDGTGDWLTIANNPAFDMTSSSYCFEAWLYPTSSNELSIFNRFDGQGGPGLSIQRLASASSRIIIFYSGTQLNGVTAVNENTWTHIACTFDGTTKRIFINGALDASTTSGTMWQNSSTNTEMAIGHRPSDNRNFYFSGFMSGVRIAKGTAIYTAAFTPPTTLSTATTNTQLLLNFTDAAILDRTGRNVVETVADARTSSVQVKYGNGAMYFDGTGDALNIRSSDTLTFGTGDWTVEFWAYHTSVSGQQTYFGDTGGATSGPYIYKDSSHKVGLYYSSQILTGTTTIAINTWYFIVLSRASGTVRLFINGTQEASASDTTNLTVPIQWIGGDTLPSGYLSGYMDDVRVTRGYARYTSNFTPPTASHRLK